MRQVVQSLKDGSIQVVDVPVPALGRGFALVRVGASLVSAGTERAAVEFGRQSLLEKARSKPHLVKQVLEKALRDGPLATVRAVINRLDSVNNLGYSCAGEVAEVGEGVTHVKPGDLVACAGAGYASHAEYVAVPKNLIVRIPAENAALLEEAAFTTLGAIALQGIRLGNPRLGEVVALIGLGLLGHITLQLLKASGCTVVGFDLDFSRVDLARRLGIDAAFIEHSGFVTACRQRTMGKGADVTLITAATQSNEPVELAGEVTREKGKVVVVGDVGLSVPRRSYYHKEIELVISRSYGPGRYDQVYEEQGHDYPYGYVRWTEQRNMQAFVDLLARGTIHMQPLITHRFPVAEAPAAYELIAGKPSEPYLGVVITYPGDTVPARSVEVPRPKEKSPTRPLGKRVGVAVVGAGAFLSSVLLPVLKKEDGVEFVGVANRNGVSARNGARRFGFRYASTDMKELLADPAVDLVVIGTPHHLHAEQAAAALVAGKHVFVEKPLCLTRDELRTVELALEKSRDRQLMVGFNRRFAPFCVKVAETLRDRREPLLVHYRVNAGFIPPDHWTQDPAVGGGRLLGEGCHFLDWMVCLTGTHVEEVAAWVMDDAGRYCGDNLVVQLRFADGSLGTLTYVANGSRRAGKERVEIYCAGHTIVLDDFRRLEISRPGTFRPERIKAWTADKGHAEECRLTVKALLDGTPPPISVPEILHSSLVTLMAHESLRLRRPVWIPEGANGVGSD